MKSHETSSLVFIHQMAPLSLPHELGEDNPGGQRDEKRHCRSAAGAMFSGEVLNIWGNGILPVRWISLILYISQNNLNRSQSCNVSMRIYKRVIQNVCQCDNVHIYTYIYIYVYICKYNTYVYIYICIFMCVYRYDHYTYIYIIYIHTNYIHICWC